MGKHDRYPEEVAAFMREHSTEYSSSGMAKELKKRFGFEKPPMSLAKWMQRRNLRLLPKAGREMPEKSKFPLDLRDYLREIAPGKKQREILQLVNERYGEGTINYDQLHAYLKNHNIRNGLDGRFEKGHVSWNKGKTLEEIIKDPEKRKHTQANQFKKGNLPLNTLPIGTIVQTKDGYLMRKRQSEGTQWERWELLHRAVWEEHNGPIPKDMIIIFKDGDKTNCNISNLELVTRGEHVRLTHMGFRSTDPAMTEAGLKVIRIQQRQKELQKNMK